MGDHTVGVGDLIYFCELSFLASMGLTKLCPCVWVFFFCMCGARFMCERPLAAVAMCSID